MTDAERSFPVRPLAGQQYVFASSEYSADDGEDQGPIVEGAKDLIDAFEDLLDNLF